MPDRSVRLAKGNECITICWAGLQDINSSVTKLVEDSWQSCSYFQPLIRALKCTSIWRKQWLPRILLSQIEFQTSSPSLETKPISCHICVWALGRGSVGAPWAGSPTWHWDAEIAASGTFKTRCLCKSLKTAPFAGFSDCMSADH